MMTNPKYLTQLLQKINEHFSDEEFRTLCFTLSIDYANIPGQTKVNKIRELLTMFDRNGRLPELLTYCTKKRPDATWTYEVRLFIAYKQHEPDDTQLALYLKNRLQADGHTVFIDQDMRSGEKWLDRIDAELRAADFLIVLLSAKAGESEMVRSEVQQAFAYRKTQGHPHTLPVCVNYEGMAQ